MLRERVVVQRPDVGKAVAVAGGRLGDRSGSDRSGRRPGPGSSLPSKPLARRLERARVARTLPCGSRTCACDIWNVTTVPALTVSARREHGVELHAAWSRLTEADRVGRRLGRRDLLGRLDVSRAPARPEPRHPAWPTGSAAPAGLTTTVPIMPGCTSQKYLYVPGLVNVSLKGLGGPLPAGRPLSHRWLPLNVLALGGANSAVLSPTLGTLPSNQNGLPAASLTPVASLPGTISGSALPALPGKSMVWKPCIWNDTESPTLMVVFLLKKALMSGEYCGAEALGQVLGRDLAGRRRRPRVDNLGHWFGERGRCRDQRNQRDPSPNPRATPNPTH